jgi:hypothetical protein
VLSLAANPEGNHSGSDFPLLVSVLAALESLAVVDLLLLGSPDGAVLLLSEVLVDDGALLLSAVLVDDGVLAPSADLDDDASAAASVFLLLA